MRIEPIEVFLFACLAFELGAWIALLAVTP